MRKIIFFTLMAISLHACTIFDTKNELNHTVVARNFDWDGKSAYLWAKKGDGKDYGYFFITYKNDKTSAVEGVNEKGLFIAISAVPTSKTAFRFKRPKKSLELVTEVLKSAKNIDEAIKVMDKFMPIFGTFMGNPMVHFKIVSNDGKSVLVEYFDKKTNIIKNAKIMTNHYIGKPSLGSENNTSFKRYNHVKNSLKNFEPMRDEKIFKILKEVSQKNTIYSSVYDLNNLTLKMKHNNKNMELDIKKVIDKNNALKGYNIDNLN